MFKNRSFKLLALAALIAGIAVAQFRSQGESLAEAGIALKDLNGAPASLDDWRGMVVVVNFWATWCAPCREEIPLLSRTFEDYRDRDVVVVGIAVDEIDAVKSFGEEVFISYPVLVLDPGEAMTMMGEYGNRIGALPFSVILDRSGAATSTKTGPYTSEELVAVLKDALNS